MYIMGKVFAFIVGSRLAEPPPPAFPLLINRAMFLEHASKLHYVLTEALGTF